MVTPVNGKVTGAVFTGLYLEMADSDMFFLGARLAGNSSIEQKVPLIGLKTKPRAAVRNECDDILASPT